MPPTVVESQANQPGVVGEWDREPSTPAAELVADEADDDGRNAWPEFLREVSASPSLAPSLLGTLVARVPGRGAVRSGVSFARVHVAAKIEGGFAYTEVEEELANDGDVAVEAIAAFRAPHGGVIERMGLWVDDRLIEAEVVERARGAEVYAGIVERSRDPALLENEPSGFVKLRVFPVPAHGARRLVVGYMQPLERRENRYQFGLGLRLPEGAPAVREMSAEVELIGVGAEQIEAFPGQPAAVVSGAHGTRVRWEGSRIRPPDWRVSFAAPQDQLTTFVPAKATDAERFVALRVAADLAWKAVQPDASVWLIDTSASQAGAALHVSKAVVKKLLKQLPPGDHFAVLACDTACVSFPRRGLALATSDSRSAARRFLAGLAARGASDVGYALFEALRRTRGRARAQLVYFGDARPTAGDLDADAMLLRLAARPELLDLRLVGVGAALEADSLNELAARLTAARTLVLGDARDARIERWLAQPTLRVPSVSLPSVFESAYPRQLPNLVRGDELLVLARLARPTSGALRGQLSGVLDNGETAEYRRSELDLALPRREVRADSVPRLWAHARLRELDDDDAPTAYRESVQLSQRYQVLSRHTSFLALEGDAMFRAFGIDQRFGRADFGPAPVVVPPSARAASTSHTHRVRVPMIRMATTVVSGRLPPEPIQRAVRQNDGRFRACYHEGLLRNPQLTGTVTTRFVIGRDGTVISATDGGSTLTDRLVVDCIVRTFKALVFPVPDGLVTVVYPFALSPSTAQEPRMQPTPWTFGEAAPQATIAPAPVRSTSAPLARVSAAELAAQVELEPTNVARQLDAARAYEAERSERRACAHFRAAATLAPRDLEVQYQALRCRARVLGERVSVLADVGRLDLHSPSIDALTTRIRTLADIPAFSATP